MKQSELKKCHICGKGMGHANYVFFYRIKMEQFVINTGAVRRQAGLEMSMGEAAPLAQILGPDEDLAVGMGENEALICASHLDILAPFLAKT